MKYLKYIDKNIPNQKGKTFIVTGATSGIGLELTKQLAYKNAKVVMAVRNIEKATKVKEDILKEIPNADLEIVKFDQADFSSIDEFANFIKKDRYDCLVLNAGIFHPTNDSLTMDGYPLTIGTNYLGPYYLIDKIDNYLKEGNIKRIVVTSSLVRVFGKTKHYKKYIVEVKNKPNRTYNVSKNLDYHFAGNLKEKYPNLEIVLTHPGLARTNIIKTSSSSFKSWFKYLGDKFLKITANSAQKSALCSLLSATKVDVKELDFVYPRGPFHLVGLPMVSHYKVSKIKDAQLESVSKQIISN